MRPRAGRYIVICMRKVRAPQGRVPDNVRRRRLQGQCNRDIPPRLCAVRLERRGKSSPAYRVTDMPCKPHPVQDWNGSACGYAAEMAARHAPDNRVSATVTLRQDRWPHVGKPTDRTRLIACSFCFYKNTDGICCTARVFQLLLEAVWLALLSLARAEQPATASIPRAEQPAAIVLVFVKEISRRRWRARRQ